MLRWAPRSIFYLCSAIELSNRSAAPPSREGVHSPPSQSFHFQVNHEHQRHCRRSPRIGGEVP